jgi:hypothetical protein
VNTGEIVSSLISGVGVLILAAIGRSLFRMGKEVHRFMAEHVWLISTTLWTRDKVTQIMKALDIPMDNPPPSDLETSKK